MERDINAQLERVRASLYSAQATGVLGQPDLVATLGDVGKMFDALFNRPACGHEDCAGRPALAWACVEAKRAVRLERGPRCRFSPPFYKPAARPKKIRPPFVSTSHLPEVSWIES